MDKRDHIGGNCYDYTDKHGIRVRPAYIGEVYGIVIGKMTLITTL
jgi:UDP-galactopyranose mutase